MYKTKTHNILSIAKMTVIAAISLVVVLSVMTGVVSYFIDYLDVSIFTTIGVFKYIALAIALVLSFLLLKLCAKEGRNSINSEE